MTDDEVDELLKAVDTSSGEINYTGKASRLRSVCSLSKTNEMQNLSKQSWRTEVELHVLIAMDVMT